MGRSKSRSRDSSEQRGRSKDVGKRQSREYDDENSDVSSQRSTSRSRSRGKSRSSSPATSVDELDFSKYRGKVSPYKSGGGEKTKGKRGKSYKWTPTTEKDYDILESLYETGSGTEMPTWLRGRDIDGEYDEFTYKPNDSSLGDAVFKFDWTNDGALTSMVSKSFGAKSEAGNKIERKNKSKRKARKEDACCCSTQTESKPRAGSRSKPRSKSRPKTESKEANTTVQTKTRGNDHKRSKKQAKQQAEEGATSRASTSSESKSKSRSKSRSKSKSRADSKSRSDWAPEGKTTANEKKPSSRRKPSSRVTYIWDDETGYTTKLKPSKKQLRDLTEDTESPPDWLMPKDTETPSLISYTDYAKTGTRKTYNWATSKDDDGETTVDEEGEVEWTTPTISRKKLNARIQNMGKRKPPKSSKTAASKDKMVPWVMDE